MQEANRSVGWDGYCFAAAFGCMRRATLLAVVMLVASAAPAAVGDGVCAGKACCAKTAEDAALRAPSCCNATSCATRADEIADIARKRAPDHGRPQSLSPAPSTALTTTAPRRLGAVRSRDGTAGLASERLIALSILRI